MNIKYRIANKNDKQSLYDLAVLFTHFNVNSSGDKKRFFWEGWEKDFADEIDESLNDPNSIYFIAYDFDTNNSMGYILSRNCPNCFYYVIEELFVKDDARGNKVGATLINMAITEGKKYSKEIRVEIFSWNESAKNFYLKNGFKLDAFVLELPK